MSAGCSSNCGLTSSNAWPSGASQAAIVGSTSVSEMNDRSATTTPKVWRGSSASKAVPARSRALMPSWATTRASAARLGLNWPRPDVEPDHAARAALQQHVGEAAGALADIERVVPGHVEADVLQAPPRA